MYAYVVLCMVDEQCVDTCCIVAIYICNALSLSLSTRAHITVADGDYVARWSSTFPGAVYKCSLNGAPAVDCSSPYVLNFQSLLNGWNSLSIKAFSGDRQIGATLSGTSVCE